VIDHILILVIAVFWRLGGFDKARWSGYRDVLVPVILGTYLVFRHNLLTGIACGLALTVIRIGYGAYDPENDPKPSFLGSVTHDRGGWWIRGLVGILYVLVGLLPVVLYTRHWFGYVLWAGVSGACGWILCRIRTPDIIIEPAIGAVLAMSVIHI